MKPKSVAIILYYPGSLKFHPSIMNSAHLLAANGYRVDIYKPFNPDEGDLGPDSIQVIHGCTYHGNPVKRIQSIRMLLASIVARKEQYSVLFGVDAYGLLIASAARARSGAPVFYFSLEILSSRMNDCDIRTRPLGQRLGYYVHNAILKAIEKRLHKSAAVTIIQDETRWEALRNLNGIDANAPVIFVPNSPLADLQHEVRSDYLRRKFDIPNDRTIVFYAGSLGVWTGIDRIVEAAMSWPEQFVLILHGRGMPQFIHWLEGEVLRANGKIVLSLDQLGESEYESMLSSADIGLSWYADRNDPNVYFIGAGSGKLFYYLKHGLPVVTNRFPGLPEIVEKNGAGMCLGQEAEIIQGLATIKQDYFRFSENARKCFAYYEFSGRFKNVLDAIR